jgi:hypothetical protein
MEIFLWEITNKINHIGGIVGEIGVICIFSTKMSKFQIVYRQIFS